MLYVIIEKNFFKMHYKLISKKIIYNFIILIFYIFCFNKNICLNAKNNLFES